MNHPDKAKKHTPKVSIGMPVYNGEKFIRKAVDSLLSQTFTDFELIISDNASNDSTEAICREYSARDSRIRYVRQNKNLGPKPNFQFVLDEAVGKYFMWAAADDEWLPTFIFECGAALDNDPSIGFVVTKSIVFSRFTPLFSRLRIPGLECVTDPDRERRLLRFSSMPFHTHKDNMVYAMWRREAITTILNKLRQSPLGIQIGASMNEYSLSLYKGGFVNKALFRKGYPLLTPDHKLELFARSVLRILRYLTGREQGKGNTYFPEQHLHDLKIILQLAQFDESFTAQVIEANHYHLRYGKAKRVSFPVNAGDRANRVTLRREKLP